MGTTPPVNLFKPLFLLYFLNYPKAKIRPAQTRILGTYHDSFIAETPIKIVQIFTECKASIKKRFSRDSQSHH